MKIDLHIHTKTGSDGSYTVEEVFQEALERGLRAISITDHDSLDAQQMALSLAHKYNIQYIAGIELNVTFKYPIGKPVSLDFLGYGFDYTNKDLNEKLRLVRDHRENRARQILQNVNAEFEKEGIEPFTDQDLQNIQADVDGSFGRPHIANYLITKGIVESRQEAFDKYLVKCDVPKYPLSPSEASGLIHNAGGIVVLAHPNDPNGTSLVKISQELCKQTEVIEMYLLDHIDGIECWHTRHDSRSTDHYWQFAQKHDLIVTGGSDCHQKPVIMGSQPMPDEVVESIQKLLSNTKLKAV